jgi:alpha-1,2-mannosyltransferase
VTATLPGQAVTPVAPSGTPTQARRSHRPDLLSLLPVAAALIVRLLQLSRSGPLTGLMEYDDGVYLGEAIRLLGGHLPYRDFVAVNPPGVPLLLAPFGALGAATAPAIALAVARLVTVLVDVVNVCLLGRVLRPYGRFARFAGMTLLALSPAEISSAHTLLLEPYVNLLALLAITVIFRGRQFSKGRGIWQGGALLGFACAVKFFALFPLLAVAVLLLIRSRRQLAQFLLAASASFLVVCAPFAVAAPRSFLHQGVLDQIVRSDGIRTPLWVRLNYLDGASLMGNLVDKAAHAWVAAALATLVVLVLVKRRREPADVLSTFSLISVAFVGFSLLWAGTFYYHYGAALAPWAALAVAIRIRPALALPPARVAVGAAAAIASVLLVAQVPFLRATPMAPQLRAEIDAVVPAHACVVADSVSYSVTADRFTAEHGCPEVIDSFGTTMAWSGGATASGLQGATEGLVVSKWESTFSSADYLVLSSGVRGSIPMNAQMRRFLATNFRVRAVLSGDAGTVYERVVSATVGGPGR